MFWVRLYQNVQSITDPTLDIASARVCKYSAAAFPKGFVCFSLIEVVKK